MGGLLASNAAQPGDHSNSVDLFVCWYVSLLVRWSIDPLVVGPCGHCGHCGPIGLLVPWYVDKLVRWSAGQLISLIFGTRWSIHLLVCCSVIRLVYWSAGLSVCLVVDIPLASPIVIPEYRFSAGVPHQFPESEATSGSP